MGNLNAHMTKYTETDHANLFALVDAPVAHGRVSRDSSAKQRSGSGAVKVRGDAQDEPLVDHDAVRVAAAGDASQMLVGKVVSKGRIQAELLEAAKHSGQLQSESTMQPTAARSPGLNLVTEEPTSVTRPTISCPGTHG
jgi:hypothetical protein